MPFSDTHALDIRVGRSICTKKRQLQWQWSASQMNRKSFCWFIDAIIPSRARASRVTEVSREGKAEKDKEEPIGTAPACLAGTVVDSVISCKSWSLTFPAFGIFVWWFHCLLIWLALVIFESWQPFLLPAVCLDVCFLADISLSTSSSDNGTFALSLHPVCGCHLWILIACFLLTAQEPATWPTLLSWQNSFPTLFAPLLSSLLFPFCFLLSSVPYSLHFPCDSYPPNITLTQQAHCDLQSLACKYLQIPANHKTTTSIPAAINNMDAAIPLQSAHLNSTLQWRTRPSAKRTKATPVAQTRFPTSTLRATLCEKT